MLWASVVICTHNPRPDYLRRVLSALRSQTLPQEHWELLFVDNGSGETLAALWDLSWHRNGRHIRENELGLSHARQRGIKEASSDLLIFVDDDNVLSQDYLDQAVKIGREWPRLGVWGGSILPDFEVEPPSVLRNYLGYLALREIHAPRWSNVPTCADAEPCGAGLCVRSSVAAAYCDYYQTSAIRLTDRTGKDLISGGDTEICYVACASGLGMGLLPELRLTHLIPRERLCEEYLLRLIEGIYTSNAVLKYKWCGIPPSTPDGIVGGLRVIKNLLTHRAIQRRVYCATLRAAYRARSIIGSAN